MPPPSHRGFERNPQARRSDHPGRFYPPGSLCYPWSDFSRDLLPCACKCGESTWAVHDKCDRAASTQLQRETQQDVLRFAQAQAQTRRSIPQTSVEKDHAASAQLQRELQQTVQRSALPQAPK